MHDKLHAQESHPPMKVIIHFLVGLIAIALLVSFVISPASVAEIKRLWRHGIQGNTHTHLSELRNGISRYYGDHNGTYPLDLMVLIPKYVRTIPVAKLAHQADMRSILIGDAHDSAAIHYVPALVSDDGGGWGYVNNAASADFGKVFINCNHTNLRGSTWSTY